ncbi:hypothetical protein DRO97_00120 [Archaeoglobales archaeon]|nr:MAG: hypothetical protein DRO97_00120 [Archaeoglobales archaeon]
MRGQEIEHAKFVCTYTELLWKIQLHPVTSNDFNYFVKYWWGSFSITKIQEKEKGKYSFVILTP